MNYLFLLNFIDDIIADDMLNPFSEVTMTELRQIFEAAERKAKK